MSTMTPTIPLRERFNFRILTFIGIFAFLLGVPLYLALDSVISGGVKKVGDVYEVDLKAMSTFPFDQQNGRIEDVPAKWRELNDKTIEMRGELAPGTYSAVGLDAKFDLVYSVAKCCFTGEPQIQHFIKVSLPPNAKANVRSDGTIVVRGKLRVDVTRDPETQKINGVYHVVADEVYSL